MSARQTKPTIYYRQPCILICLARTNHPSARQCKVQFLRTFSRRCLYYEFCAHNMGCVQFFYSLTLSGGIFKSVDWSPPGRFTLHKLDYARVLYALDDNQSFTANWAKLFLQVKFDARQLNDRAR